MSWSDRQYSQDGPLYGAPQKSACFWIIAITVAIQIVIWLTGGGRGGIGTNRVESFFALDWQYLASFQVWRWVSYAFLHGGVSHLFWNMLLLYFMGLMLEPHLGRRRFVQLYLAFSAISALGFPIEEALRGPPYAPRVIGASGAVMGMVALFGARFPRAQVRFILIPLSGAAMAGLIVGLDVLRMIASPQGDGTAHGVHLAGASAGLVYGLYWSKIELFLDSAKAKRERKKAGKAADRKRADTAEMDRILEKISIHGMGELTKAEREFMRQQSERLKSGS